MNRLLATVAVGCIAANAALVRAEGLNLPITSQDAAATVGLTRPWAAQLSIGGRSKLIDLQLDHGTLFSLSDSGRLQATDAENGQRLWLTEFGNRDYPSSRVGIGAKHLAVTNGSTLYVFDRKTGGELAAVRLQFQPSPGAPAVGEGWIYVGGLNGAVEGIAPPPPKQQPGEEPPPERRDYVRPPVYRGTGVIASAAKHVGDSVVWGTDAGYVYGLRADDLSARFRFRTNGPVTAPFGYKTPLVFAAAADSNLYAIDDVTGELQWRLSLPEIVRRQPIALGENLYVSPQGDGMYCLAPENGDVRWSNPLVEQVVAASPSRLYTADVAGRLLVQNAANGAVLGAIDTRRLPTKVTNLETDRIYLANADGFVECLREIDATAPFMHAPAPAEEAAEPEADKPAPPAGAPATPAPPPQEAPEPDPDDPFAGP